MDFRGLPFGPMPTLPPSPRSRQASGDLCSLRRAGEPQPASRQRRPALWESPTILVGGRESYEARCRIVIKVPRRMRIRRRCLIGSGERGAGPCRRTVGTAPCSPLRGNADVALTGNIAAGKSTVVDLFHRGRNDHRRGRPRPRRPGAGGEVLAAIAGRVRRGRPGVRRDPRLAALRGK